MNKTFFIVILIISSLLICQSTSGQGILGVDVPEIIDTGEASGSFKKIINLGRSVSSFFKAAWNIVNNWVEQVIGFTIGEIIVQLINVIIGLLEIIINLAKKILSVF